MTVFRDYERELLRELVRIKVDFVLVGGAAVVMHGFDRNRPDIDILVSPERVNIEKLADFDLQWLHFKEKHLAALIEQGWLDLDQMKVQFLTRIKGVSTKDCFEKKTTLTDCGLEVPVISKELLMVSKNAVGEPKDIENVKGLLKI